MRGWVVRALRGQIRTTYGKERPLHSYSILRGWGCMPEGGPVLVQASRGLVPVWLSRGGPFGLDQTTDLRNCRH